LPIGLQGGEDDGAMVVSMLLDVEIVDANKKLLQQRLAGYFTFVFTHYHEYVTCVMCFKDLLFHRFEEGERYPKHHRHSLNHKQVPDC